MSAANKIVCMKRRELTSEEKDEAQRLNAAWLDFKAKNAGATQTWLAAEAGLGTQGAVGQYLRGVIPLNLQALLAICRVIGKEPREISPRLFKNLVEFPSVAAAAEHVSQFELANYYARAPGERRKVMPRPDVLEIARYDVAGSMGAGLVMPEYTDVIERMTVSASWLRSNVKFSAPSNLALITAYGDSMEGTFKDGDMLLVDRGVEEVKIDAVYVLALNDELYIKRLQRRPDGTLLMISDNKKYDPYVIKNGELERFRVLGRVLLAWNATRL